MRRTSWVLVVASLSWLGFGASTASAIEASDLAGTYTCRGKNANGSTYSGTVTIKHTGGNRVSVHWDLGSEQDDGAGVLRKDNSLEVVYKGGAKGKVTFVVKMNGKRLVGTWRNKGGASGEETLVKK